MSKCGKGCMPECEYFTTGGCVSLFNCPYKIEQEDIITTTQFNLYAYETDKDAEIVRLTAVNIELHRQIVGLSYQINELDEELERVIIKKAEVTKDVFERIIEKTRAVQASGYDGLGIEDLKQLAKEVYGVEVEK